MARLDLSFEIKTGGSLTLKNVLISGSNNNDEVAGVFVANTGGDKMIVDNCAFVDWQNFALRNQHKGEMTSITNCVFVNGARLRYSPWGGFPLRMDVACDNVIIENNSVVNSGRLTGNSGPWFNANIQEMHNTYVNQTVAGHEQRANEMITANNIFYNYHVRGRQTENHSNGASNNYDAHFTTWNYFADSKDNLDSISLYLGQNLFYRDQGILDWFNTVGGDSLAPSLLWEHPDVDSFITIDNNYTIGTNYAELDPGFAVNPGVTDEIIQSLNGYWIDPTADWVDWRVPSPVTFNAGQPVLNWPPAFDLNYSNAYLQTAGTDGLPLGDLNWFPDKKTEFLDNRAAIVDAIRDSMVNAQAVYDPTTMDNTPLITSAPTISTDQIIAGQLYLTNFPNPFDKMTVIQYGLEQSSDVTLSVSNMFGQQVFVLAKTGLPSGPHTVDFDASNLSSGVYIININVLGKDGKNYVASKKMIVSK